MQMNQTHFQMTNTNKVTKNSVDINPELTNDWLYEAASKSWSIWLPDSALETVRRTGSYVLNKSKQLKLIVLNTNYCARINFWQW